MAAWQVIATFPVGGSGSHPYDIAFTPDGAHAYVSDNSNSNLYVVDVATHATTATIDTTITPNAGVVVSPDGTRVFVGINPFEANGAVVDIDIAVTTVTDVLGVNNSSSSDYSGRLAISNDGTTLWYAGAQAVFIIDTSTDAATGFVSETTGEPTGRIVVAGSGSGADVYAPFGTDEWHIVGTSSSAIGATTRNPLGMAIHGSDLFVTNSSPSFVAAGVVEVRSLTAGTLASTVTGFPFFPLGNLSDVAVTGDGAWALVTQTDVPWPYTTGRPFGASPVRGHVYAIDTAIPAIAEIVPVGVNPLSISIAPGGQQAWVSNNDDGTISVLARAGGAWGIGVVLGNQAEGVVVG